MGVVKSVMHRAFFFIRDSFPKYLLLHHPFFHPRGKLGEDETPRRAIRRSQRQTGHGRQQPPRLRFTSSALAHVVLVQAALRVLQIAQTVRRLRHCLQRPRLCVVLALDGVEVVLLR